MLHVFWKTCCIFHCSEIKAKIEQALAEMCQAQFKVGLVVSTKTLRVFSLYHKFTVSPINPNSIYQNIVVILHLQKRRSSCIFLNMAVFHLEKLRSYSIDKKLEVIFHQKYDAVFHQQIKSFRLSFTKKFHWRWS